MRCLSLSPFTQSTRAAIVAAALFATLHSGTALAITPDQAAAQDRFVQQVQSSAAEIDLIKNSLDNYEKLYSARLNPGADTAAMEQALVNLLRMKLEVQDNWIFGQDARQNSAFSPLITALDEVSKAVIFGGTLVPTAGVSPEAQSSIQNANVKVREAMTSYLDIGKNAPYSSATESKLNTTNRQIQGAIRFYNQMSEADRKRTPGGLAMFQNILNILRFVEDTQDRWQREQKEAEALRGTCVSQRDALKSGLRHMIEIGVNGRLQSRGSIQEAAWLQEIDADLKAADALVAQCNNPEQMKVFAACYTEVSGPESLTHFYKENDPEAWCMVAPKMRSLLIEEAILTAQWRASTLSTASSVENRADSDGWVSSDSLTTFETQFTLNPQQRQTMIDPIKPIFEALGMDDNAFEDAFAPLEESLKKQGNDVLANAPSIQRMKGPSTFYGVDLAKAQVQRALPGSQIVTGSSYGEWSVTKNALGTPLYRDRNGWVMFQVPGDEYCQERSFHASEKWTGSGYARDKSVSFSNVRWLPCSQ